MNAPRWNGWLHRPERLAPALHSVAALVTRLVLGFTVLRSGLEHAVDRSGLAGTLAGHGAPLPGLLAPLGLLLELAGGTALLLGIGTRAMSLLLALPVVAALLTTDRVRLLEAAVPGGELWLLEVLPLVQLMLLAWLLIRGAGRLSCDHFVDRWLSVRRSAASATDPDAPTQVVILGGGFGGMYAAMELERIFAGDAQVRVTVVNQDNFLLFTPMLHEVAASDLDLTHIVSASRKLLQGVEFVNGEVQSVDVQRREVVIVHGDEHSRLVLRYDHLVVALGSVTNFYNLPGLADGAFTMRTLGDALALRNRMIASMEEANVTVDAAQRERLLTFVVAGGGFAGVETIAAINDSARETRRYYPNLDESDIRMVLVHSGDRILPELSARLGSYALDKLTERGVEVRLRERVLSLSDRGVRLGDGSMLPARTLVWTAGTAPHPLLAMLPCAKERGRLVVDATLAVPGYAGLWSLGDCAVVPDLVRGGSCPPTAQHATRQGRLLAANIAAVIRGEPPRAFRFRMLGQLAALGRRSGVAQMFGLRFSGFVAWWLWRSVYLLKLPGFERKVRVALDWTLDLLFAKDLVKYPTDRAPAAHRAKPAAAELQATIDR